MAVCLVGRKKTDQAPSGVPPPAQIHLRKALQCPWVVLKSKQEIGTKMQDTKNIYLIELADGVSFEVTLPEGDDQADFFIDQYYKGRIARLWINGVEFEEPTE